MIHEFVQFVYYSLSTIGILLFHMLSLHVVREMNTYMKVIY